MLEWQEEKGGHKKMALKGTQWVKGCGVADIEQKKQTKVSAMKNSQGERRGVWEK